MASILKLAPGVCAGALILLVSAILPSALGFPVAAVLGLSAFVGLWWFTRDRDRLQENLKDEVGPKASRALTDEIRQVQAFIVEIERLNASIPDRPMTAALHDITHNARFLLNDVVQDPSLMRIMRKPFQVYLPEVVSLSRRFSSMQRFETIDPAVLSNTRAAFVDLNRLLERYKTKLHTSEQQDIDVQIAVLEQRLKEEGFG